MGDDNSDDKRQYARFKVGGGNAEIKSVFGRGRNPGERARVMNWSRGGMLLKVPSPRRRFLIQKLDPVLYENDTVTCTLHLPPKYDDIEVRVEVRHVERDPRNPDLLNVGVAFDEEHTPADRLLALARMLEPKARTVSGRLKKISATSERISRRLSSGEIETPQRKKRKSRRSKRVSARQAKQSRRSKRVKAE